MPRNVNPGSLRSGPGRRVPERWTNAVVLHGPGMAGAGPNIGQAGWVPSGGVAKDLPSWVAGELVAPGGALAGFRGHVTGPEAHQANQIGLVADPVLWAKNVDLAFDEVAGRFPHQPPVNGEHPTWIVTPESDLLLAAIQALTPGSVTAPVDPQVNPISGIADWGALKLNDNSLVERGHLTSENPSSLIFPYYHQVPSPALTNTNNVPFLDRDHQDTNNGPAGGNDPQTDWLWNSGMDPVAGLEGTGEGLCYAGAFTRNGTVAGQEVMRTVRLLERSTVIDGAGTGLPERQVVTISGTVFPADRGVLALIHWPAGTPGTLPGVSDFLAPHLMDRVVAAILLGQGLNGDPCTTGAPCDGPHVCDGDPGGIFATGVDANGTYNPFEFPGRASGQFDLAEVLTGVDGLNGDPLPAPWNNLVVNPAHAGDGSPRVLDDIIPGAGQVRLGTDPQAGAGTLSYGIPILGAGAEGYDPTPATLIQLKRVVQDLGAGAPEGHTVIESPLAPAGANFFRYRLPYLKDYQPAGLKWTPSGTDPASSKEKFRYFTPAQPNSGLLSPIESLGTTLPTAGNYGQPFTEDYYTYQVARFRHQFMLPSTAAGGQREDVGTYWLIHFKRERDFEAFVRDGIMPWDATAGYELYGAQAVDGNALTTTANIEADDNLVNDETATTVPAPYGPAPTYGYAASSYHFLRSTILMDPTPVTMPAFTASYDLLIRQSNPAADDAVMWCSGVAYFTPRIIATGNAGLEINQLSVVSNAAGFWTATYRTDETRLTGVAGTAPAVLSSPAPAFIDFSAFGYDAGATLAGSVVWPRGAAGPTVLTDEDAAVHQRHVEIPFTHCGTNGAGVFSDANGPLEADLVTIGHTDNAVLEGDLELPAFTQDLTLRIFFRRPIGHRSALESTLPYSVADGHGVVIPEDTETQPIMLHTTRWDDAAAPSQAPYGNFTQPLAGPFPTKGDDALFTDRKDVEERFLDETHRWRPTFQSAEIDPIFGAGAVSALIGPGMGGWIGGPIDIPVRAGLAPVGLWDTSSWLQMGFHIEALGTTENGLQVAGLADRNPPITDGGVAPFPSSGRLIYPQHDYSAAGLNVRPRGGTDMLTKQPDYSAETGIRSYIRAFDCAYSKGGYKPALDDVAGQPFVTLRFDGIELEDFEYTAPGPGRREDSALAIFVKVPGLTTWMDVGRADGAGPGKQDIALDGAGCRIFGPESFNGVDPATGQVFCQVKINVGPGVNLFKNTGTGGPYQDAGATDFLDEVPLLVKVEMRETAANWVFERSYDKATKTFGTADVGHSSAELRGLLGIQVFYPTK